MNEPRALNTAQECEEYFLSEFPMVAQIAMPYLRKLTQFLNKDIGNDLFRIKGYKRRDGIGFCVAEKDDQITKPQVRTNFVVIKPEKRIIDFYHPGPPNNFAIIMQFNEVDTLSRTELNQQFEASFSGRVLDKNLPVRW